MNNKTFLIEQIVKKGQITAEDFLQSSEFPEVQTAIAESFDLSVMELRGRLEQSPMEFNLRTFGELSKC